MAKLVRINTKIEVAEYGYQWNIENFRYSCNRPAGKAIYSPIFSIPNTKVKGCLKVYPSGVSEDYKDYVSVYLELKNYEDTDLVGKFDLWIPQDDQSGKSSAILNFSLKESFGYPDYIKREYVLNKKNDVLEDEKLCFMCYVSMNTGVMNNSNMPDSDDEIESVESSLVKDFKRLLDERSHTDVTLKIGEQRFEAHKLILMARSEKFKKIFTEQSVKTEFEIHDVSVESMNVLLQYVYTGKVNFASLKIMEFAGVAYRYGLYSPELQSKCEKELFRQINVENAIDVFVFALGWDTDYLFKNSLNYIAQNFREIALTESYKNILKSKCGGADLILERVSDNLLNNPL